jgi:antitoxin component YwqK of YwqJK toxin-antitoxin module
MNARRRSATRPAACPHCGAPAGGKKDGVYKLYYENGQMGEKSTYAAGEYHGPYESYYENGQLEWKGTYNMGEKCGEWVEEGETVTYDPC